jgi:hypothetical protein
MGRSSTPARATPSSIKASKSRALSARLRRRHFAGTALIELSHDILPVAPMTTL